MIQELITRSSQRVVLLITQTPIYIEPVVSEPLSVCTMLHAPACSNELLEYVNNTYG